MKKVLSKDTLREIEAQLYLYLKHLVDKSEEWKHRLSGNTIKISVSQMFKEDKAVRAEELVKPGPVAKAQPIDLRMLENLEDFLKQAVDEANSKLPMFVIELAVDKKHRNKHELLRIDGEERTHISYHKSFELAERRRLREESKLFDEHVRTSDGEITLNQMQLKALEERGARVVPRKE